MTTGCRSSSTGVSRFEDEWRPYLQEAAGDDYTPVANVKGGVVVVAARGTVYWISDCLLMKIGENEYDGLNCLLTSIGSGESVARWDA